MCCVSPHRLYARCTRTGVIDNTVSFDRSWMTGGHKSLYGIGCFIEAADFAVLTLYCQSYSYASISATEARPRLGFSSGMNSTQTATATTMAPLVAWRWQLQRSCGSVLSSPIVSDTRRCCRMVSRASTSTCVICACMAVMSILQRRNVWTMLPGGWVRHSANWQRRGRRSAHLSVDVGMGNWSRRRSSSSPGTTVRRYVAIPVTWMQCCLRHLLPCCVHRWGPSPLTLPRW